MVLKNGSKGEGVTSLQRALKILGFNCGVADGIFVMANEQKKAAFDVKKASGSIKEAINKGSLNKGMSICLIRAFIANGINFTVYENTLKLLDDKK